MNKIASPQDLQNELRRLVAYAESENPSREKLGSELHDLASRVAGQKEAVDGSRQVWAALEGAWVRGDLANDPSEDPRGTFQEHHKNLLQAIRIAGSTPSRGGKIPKGQLASLADAVVLFAYGWGMLSSNAAKKQQGE